MPTRGEMSRCTDVFSMGRNVGVVVRLWKYAALLTVNFLRFTVHFSRAWDTLFGYVHDLDTRRNRNKI